MALRLALDTNRYTDLCRGDADVVRHVEEAERVLLPFVVVGELRAGFAAGSRGRENERILQRFLGKPGVGILFPTDVTTKLYAVTYRELRAAGTPIPTNDLWIAALTREHGLVLYSRDPHFRRVAAIELL